VSKKAKKTNEFGFGRAHPLNDYRRIKGRKSPGKVIVIVCEGQETEPNYFEALRQKYRLRTLNVRVVSGKGAPISVVNRAVDEKKKIDDPADEVWCVFDTENPNENPSLKTAIEKAKKAKLNLAVSNPAFEYWYFIHFDPSSRPFANGQGMKRALKVYIPDYSENANVFPKLDKLTPIAIKNAENLRRLSLESWDIFPDPSTGIDKLVAEIIEMAHEKRY
jgi:hypothetical protein